MFTESKGGYSPLTAGSSDCSEHEETQSCASDGHHRRPRDRWQSFRTAFLISGCLNLVLVAILTIQYASKLAQVLNPELRALWGYSPLHDLIDLELSPARVNGSLFPGNSPSLGRQMPNNASDEIWAEYEFTRMFPVTRQQIVDMGKDPETAAKLEDSLWGLGDDAYAAQFDVFHQIHCLNTLRQMAYGEYYNKTMMDESTFEGTMMHVHVNHCVDILLQALQCSGNVNLITMHWVETQSHPFPDMSINRKCIDFERLVDWRRDNSIDMDHYVKVMDKPAGVKEKPMSGPFFAAKGRPNPHPDMNVPDDSI